MCVNYFATLLCIFALGLLTSGNVLTPEEYAYVDGNYSDEVETDVLKIANDNAAKLEDLVKCFIYEDEITLSGHAMGGSFAQILHLTHSNYFVGIGLFCSPFYKCGDYSKDVHEWYSKCGVPGNFPIAGYVTNLDGANVYKSIRTLKVYEKKRLIKPLSYLEHQKLYHWKGTVDEYVSLNVSFAVTNIYEPQLKSPYQMASVVQYGGHYVPTVDKGNPCTKMIGSGLATPSATTKKTLFIGKCGYNGAYEMLNFLLSDPGFHLIRPNKPKLQPLLEFSLTEYFQGIPEPIGLDDVGYIYIPKRCQRAVTTCHLHFYFHTCFAARGFNGIGTLHVQATGFLEVAEVNGIIVIFPQAKVTSYNDGACFDYFGYTGKNYANKHGQQVRVMEQLLTFFRNKNPS